ncbi:TIGR00725 family protein [Myxococcota bacterium]|nr:TIGR00725 family protein [Myxococcota bacterium]MBU1381993.1 TIGR00725 family protein [Myxococcota bacterium]MBU1497670.1 TIGR00725 family protein [Myxococcota bacterium]
MELKKIRPTGNISVIGSSGPISDNVCKIAREVGLIVGKSGLNLICGGRDGVMEAACKGMSEVSDRKGRSIAILPGNDASGANQYADVIIPTGIGYARNSIVALSGDIVIIIGGASGTLCEAAYAWQYDKIIVAMVKSGGVAVELGGKVLDYRRNDPVIACADMSQLEVLINNYKNGV